MTEKIYVIGAGIVGISCAIALQRDGHQVVIIDKTGPAAGASFGNAGAIVNGSCIPTATPGIALSAMKMLMSNGPLAIDLASLPRLLPWLVRFVIQSSERNYQHNAKALVSLTKQATKSWQTLLDSQNFNDSECQNLFKNVGWLRLFETSATFNANLAARNLMQQCGTDFTILNADDIYQLEPNLNKIFKHGFFQADCHFVASPEKMCQLLTAHFIENGGQLQIADVREISVSNETSAASLPVIKTTTGDIHPKKIVLCAGAWSAKIAAGLNYKVPLMAERGYHLMLPATHLISRPIVNADQSIVLSPMQSGLRMTSQVELATVDTAPDYQKIRSLLPQVKRMLSGVDLTEQSVWMGARPSLPDSLPIISQSTHPDIFYAFGHQHLGMTLGPLTGQLIADLLAKRPTATDLSAFRADRF